MESLETWITRKKHLIIAIGNAPSSGSTLLADLVDSLPFAVCGPELRLFSVPGYYRDFERIRRKGFFSSKTPAIYEMRLRFLDSKLPSYGFDQARMRNLIKESSSFQELSVNFFQTYSALRGKDGQIFFEKTPENIHCAKLFLDAFKDGIFLHIVRNPLFVYKSLMRRGFLPYMAANTWLIDEASVYELKNHERFFTIRYEELVRDPCVTIVGFLREVGIDFDPEELAELYQSNTYRREFEHRVDSWSFTDYGMIGDANRKPVTDDDLRALSLMLKTKVGRHYAREFSLPEISFQELSKANGYSFDNLPESCSLDLGNGVSYDLLSFRFLLKKSLTDLIYRDCGIGSILNYLRPVETVFS